MSDEQFMSAQSEPWPRPHRYTVEDYYRMGETGVLAPGDRTELIEGEIVDMPPIGSEHAFVVTRLTERLVRAADESAEVRVQAPVRFMPRSEPQPDLALVKRAGNAYRNGHPVADDVLLLIEVSDSTLRYDLSTKARLYATNGIREYWVVDLVNRRLVRHRAPAGRSYTHVDEVTRGPLPLPTLVAEISLADLF
jgi:Uma2 family endonuclease